MKANTLAMIAVGVSGSYLGAVMLQAMDVGQIPWFVARATGIVAFAAMSVSMMIGLSISDKSTPKWISRSLLFETHQFLSVLSLVFIGLHAGSLLADSFMKLSALDILVPGVAAYERTWTAVGVAGAWVTLMVTASWWFRAQIGHKTWRKLHFLTFIAYVASLLHGLGAGTDTDIPVVFWGYVFSAATVAGLLVYRIADSRQRHAKKAHTAAAPASIARAA